MKEKQAKIHTIEKHIQFTVVLGLFFPVLLEALFGFSGTDSKDISETILKSGLVIFVLIVNYLLFEWRKNYFSKIELEIFKWAYVGTILCYASVILFFGFLANGNIQTLNWYIEILYPTTLIGAMYLPIAGSLISFWNIIPDKIKL